DAPGSSTCAFRGGGLLVPLLVLAALVTPARADLEAEAGPVVAAASADTFATNLGRYMLQGRWNELLDEELYTIAPKGAWSEKHPAWRAARASLAMAIRRQTLSRMDGDAGRTLRDGVIEHASSPSPA